MMSISKLLVPSSPGQHQRHHHQAAAAASSTLLAKTLLLIVATTLLLLPSASAATFDVSPTGDPYSIEAAMALAEAGDTLVLADGVYDEPIVTVRDGDEGKPITVSGGRGAVINAAFDDRMVVVRHSWISIQGLTIDGEFSKDDAASSYVDKCVFVWGLEDPRSISLASGDEAFASVIGFEMNEVTVKNCGGECIRLKHFVTNSRLTDNVVENCGVHDFRYEEGGKNGEAIYIGTSSKQWTDGPDRTSNNLVSGNKLTPNGNECVDIKEGATGNIIEYNDCQEQLDAESGCYGSRGDGNVFRYNTGDYCTGAGIRLGGWEVDGEVYGQHCNVYGNDFTNTGTGVIVARRLPQGYVCENTCSDGLCDVVGDDIIALWWDKPCEDMPDEDGDGYVAPKTAPETDDGEDGGAGGGGQEPLTTTTSSCQAMEILASYLSSSSSEQGNSVENLIDGSLTTRWSAEGLGAWIAIDLPKAVSLSGIQAAFEDGRERTQNFELVVVGDTEVYTTTHSSSGASDALQLFEFGGERVAKAVIIVAYGNSFNAWNSFTEVKLCAGKAG